MLWTHSNSSRTNANKLSKIDKQILAAGGVVKHRLFITTCMLTLENEAAYLKYWEEKGFLSAAEEEQLDVEIDEQLQLEELADSEEDSDSEAEPKVSGTKRQRDADSSDAKPAVKRRKLAGQHDHDSDSEAEPKVSGTKRQRDVSEDTGTPAPKRAKK
jgi:hypothetical protein